MRAKIILTSTVAAFLYLDVHAVGNCNFDLVQGPASSTTDRIRQDSRRMNIMKTFSEAELVRFLEDDVYAADFYGRTEMSGVKITYEYLAKANWLHLLNEVRWNAAVLLSRRANSTLIAGQPITSDQFKYQAGLLGGAVKMHDLVYRIDQRSPDVVLGAGGFFPNPHKSPLTLWEHVSAESAGGGNFVSTSLTRSNPQTAKFLCSGCKREYKVRRSADFLDEIDGFARDLIFRSGTSLDSIDELVSRVKIELRTLTASANSEPFTQIEISIFKGYEYELGPVIGMEVPINYGIPNEREVVTLGISSSSIKNATKIEAMKIRVFQNGKVYLPDVTKVIVGN